MSRREIGAGAVGVLWLLFFAQAVPRAVRPGADADEIAGVILGSLPWMAPGIILFLWAVAGAPLPSRRLLVRTAIGIAAVLVTLLLGLLGAVPTGVGETVARHYGWGKTERVWSGDVTLLRNLRIEAVTTGAFAGREFLFSPTWLYAWQGEKRPVTVTNGGAVAHSFVITELGVNTGLVDSKKSKTVEFTPNRTGSFKFFCDVPGHREAGMEGTIEVLEGEHFVPAEEARWGGGVIGVGLSVLVISGVWVVHRRRGSKSKAIIPSP